MEPLGKPYAQLESLDIEVLVLATRASPRPPPQLHAGPTYLTAAETMNRSLGALDDEPWKRNAAFATFVWGR